MNEPRITQALSRDAFPRAGGGQIWRIPATRHWAPACAGRGATEILMDRESRRDISPSNSSTGAEFRAKMAGKARQCWSLLLGLSLFAVSAVYAQTPTPEMPPMKPELELRLKKLETELRCLVCQNQTLAESPAGLAGDLRREVRLLAESGKNDAEIKEHLKARYGDFVLYKPELGSRTWLLWFGPFVLLVGGAGLVVLIQRRVRAAPSTPAALAEKDRARADKLLDE